MALLLITPVFPQSIQATTLVVSQRNPNTSDADGDGGTESQPFKTIAPAAQRAPALFKVTCEPVEDVDKDFFGNLIVRSRIVPGPFQNLKEGGNVFPLWQPASPSR